MDLQAMEDRMERMERTIQVIVDMQAQAEVLRQKAEKETAQLRRVLLATIRAGRRSRDELNERFNMLVQSQIRTDEKFQSLETKFESLGTKFEVFLDSLGRRNPN